MRKDYLLGACRTVIGKMGGPLSLIPAVELCFIVIKETMKRADLSAADIDHVFMGCVIQD